MAQQNAAAAFQVTGWSHWAGGLVERHKKLFLTLADIESKVMADALDARPIEKPIFVTGLARAGTTIVLEALAGHPVVGTHRYSDYPFVYLPYWWGELSRSMLKQDYVATERAHGDRLAVTPHSPEAMEEALWMAFFPHLHGKGAHPLLDASTSNPEFESHYRSHIQKLLLSRGKGRYVSKGNYNISRMAYLQKIFADARFVIPVRAPEGHIASLMRQHRHFMEGLTGNEKGREHLRRIGHFEFGPEREAISVTDMSDVDVLWANGEELRGWARYWAKLYGFVADQMAATDNLQGAALILRYEDFCAESQAELSRVFTHAGLDCSADWLQGFARGVSAPSYYKSGFTEADRAIIRAETADVAQRLGFKL
ncbi:MAG: sulfotransferase [Hyphomicrobiales bacterium]